jgi:hypothetical protein
MTSQKIKPQPYVQEMIAGTNGNHYVDLIGKLEEYPIPEIPLPSATAQELLLDIGVGWGRWQQPKKDIYLLALILKWNLAKQV